MSLLSRRALLGTALVAGTAGIARETRGAATPTPQCADADEPTPEQIEGPYFKPRSPHRHILVEPNSRARIMTLEGTVLTRSCRPVLNALLDLWHADEKGEYDNSGFRYRGHQFTFVDGRYRFHTIVPAPYPGRTRHFHMRVQAPGHRMLLTTQLYFPGEPLNDDDFIFDPALLMRVADGAAGHTGSFDFVLDIA